MWIYRRTIWNILGRPSNQVDEVLSRIKKGVDVMSGIKTEKIAYFGYVVRGERYYILQLKANYRRKEVLGVVLRG